MNCFWGCKWEAVSVMQGEYTFLQKGDATAILYRCKRCGKVKSKTINGLWTLEEIRGEK